MKNPEISVGIVSALKISFTLNGIFKAKGENISGNQEVSLSEGGILWKDNLYKELTFIPQEEKAFFSLHEVTIGINFHWERKETQSFTGALKLTVDEGKITAINLLPVEDYLVSVISSEMSATSSLEFLKAHAVISRSWLFAQMEKRKALVDKNDHFFSFIKTDNEYIRWYDREDHTIFDVCADDHCQRYQGITKASNPTVQEAVKATSGEILMHDNQVCDARFSKCCGGITEEFEYCWEDKHIAYLKAVSDEAENAQTLIPDLTKEEEAEQWIRTSPPAFCHTDDQKILSQILNNFDQETTRFYRWKVCYSQDELAELIRKKTQTDYGQILDLIPIERGKSGRICKLKIVGSKKTLIIGKELEIRRTLSDTHLFSSAFVVDKDDIQDGIPKTFTLTGAGWGHGVGLCQIGAAVMGERGYTYDQILIHYYQGAEIRKIY
jgi:SpoIID/LytB domain protein